MWDKELILKELKANGKKITQQRRIIVEVLAKEECENAKELYYRASKIDATIGLATVYRTLTTLEEIGVIEKMRGYVSKY